MCTPVWSIVAIRAFRDPSSCNWPIIDEFPPRQDPPLQATILNKLIQAWDTADGANLMYNSDVSVTKGEQVTQLVDCMHRVVKELA